MSVDTNIITTDGKTLSIHVINLERAKARRDCIIDTLAAAGVTKLTLFKARDLTDPAVAKRLDAFPDSGPWGQFRPHDKACTLSHLDAMQDIVASGTDYALVFEDDIFVASDMGDWVNDMSWWPQGADIVKLERWRDDNLRVCLAKPDTAHLGRTISALKSRHSGCAGYFVSQKGARKLVKMTTPDMPIDHLLFNPVISAMARDLSGFQVHPALVVQGNEPEGSSLNTRNTLRRKRTLVEKLIRGWADIAPFPMAALRTLFGRGRIARIQFAATTPQTLTGGHTSC